MNAYGLTENDEPRITPLAYHIQCYLDSIICPGCPRCQPKKFN